MDLQGDIFVVTNFFQGSLSFYEIRSSRIQFIKELNLNSFICAHGVRFIPGHPDLVWVSYCGSDNKCIQIINLRTESIIHHIPFDEQAQDVASIGVGAGRLRAPQVARTPHISEGIVPKERPLKKMYATAYLFDVPAEIATSPPVLLDKWHGKGHLDAAKKLGNKIFGANQYTDCVDIFDINGARIKKCSKCRASVCLIA